jgi:hypothetical protein
MFYATPGKGEGMNNPKEIPVPYAHSTVSADECSITLFHPVSTILIIL